MTRHGVFNHRLTDLCHRHGLDVQAIDCPWSSGAPADWFQSILADDRNHDIRAVLVTHNETATGVRSDIQSIRSAMNATAHYALLMVDCVSSLASMPFDFDGWGVEIAVSGSQKRGGMLAAGMAILCVSPKALAAMDVAQLPRTFFDFRDMLDANASGGSPYTPPLQLICGLLESLSILFDEGLDNVYARHFRLSEGTRRAVEAWGFSLVAQSPDLYSDTVCATGQATSSAEMLEQTGGLDAVIAPIGGGGVVSGSCLTVSNLAPDAVIYAAEPEQADDANRSFKAGRIIADHAPKTVAGGLLFPLKKNTWHFVSRNVADIFTASEDEIVAAMKLVWKHLRLVIEPSSAVPLATILRNPEVFEANASA